MNVVKEMNLNVVLLFSFTTKLHNILHVHNFISISVAFGCRFFFGDATFVELTICLKDLS
jgi:hypothetical protein